MPTHTGLPEAGDLMVSATDPGIIFEVTERVGSGYPYNLWVARDDNVSLRLLPSATSRNDGQEVSMTVDSPQYLEMRGWSLLEVPGAKEAWARALNGRQLASRLMVLGQIESLESQRALLREAAFRLNTAA